MVKKRLLLGALALLPFMPPMAMGQCPQMTTVLVDACNGTGTEGDNEFMIIKNGSQSLSPQSIDLYYSTTLGADGTPSGNNVNTTTHFGGSGFSNTYSAAELAFIDNLNAANTCTPATQIFARPAGITTTYAIPANAFFIVLQVNQTVMYDWTKLCAQAGSQPVHIVFEHNNNGSSGSYSNGFSTGTSGRFKNNSGNGTGTSRYFSLKSSTYPGCTEVTSVKSYLPALLPNYMGSPNGATLSWNNAGETIYSNNGCAAAIPLPVHLLRFTGNPQEDGVMLRWTTTCESAMADFAVEKATAGGFYIIGSVAATNGGCRGATEYSFNDIRYTTARQLYRLRMADLSGKFSYSNTLSFNGGKADSKLRLRENPVGNELHIVGLEAGTPYRITDLSGRMVGSGTATGYSGAIQVSSLTSGFYLLQNGGASLRFIKE